jgi:translocation protein SEC63
MGKSNFQYDETGNTYSYVALTFLGLILVPATIYFWPKKKADDKDKKKKFVQESIFMKLRFGRNFSDKFSSLNFGQNYQTSKCIRYKFLQPFCKIVFCLRVL